MDGVHDLDSALGGVEDDVGCYNAAYELATGPGYRLIGGCIGTDIDFDGEPYRLTWPGTFMNASQDRSLHAQPVRFTSPLFKDGESENRNYDRIAFEADLPRIEFLTNPPCNRTTGANCVNPPQGAQFYPLFTTAQTEDENCVWQLGGTHIPGTTNTFGGTSTTEFGPLLQSAYPAAGGMAIFRYNNFRQVLSRNPCRLEQDQGEGRDGNDDSVKFNDSSKQPQNSSLSYQDRSQGWNLQSVNGVRAITYNGSCVSLAGDALLNGNSGYLFTFEACDLSALGTEIGNFSIAVTGPLGFLYQKSALLTTGYVLVHPL